MVGKASIPLLQEKGILESFIGFLILSSVPNNSTLTSEGAQVTVTNLGPSQGCHCTQNLRQELGKRRTKWVTAGGPRWSTARRPSGPHLPRLAKTGSGETSAEGGPSDELQGRWFFLLNVMGFDARISSGSIIKSTTLPWGFFFFFWHRKVLLNWDRAKQEPKVWVVVAQSWWLHLKITSPNSFPELVFFEEEELCHHFNANHWHSG